jgi:ribonucleoside-diphosphate reductase alpha chain
MDYLFRWLGAKFVKDDDQRPVMVSEVDASGDLKRIAEVVETASTVAVSAPAVVVVDASLPAASNGHSQSNGNGNGHAKASNGNGHGKGTSSSTTLGASSYSFIARSDAPTCSECGSIMIPNGSCHKCVNCGTTSGCS